MIQRCPACHKSIFYPRVCCPFCQHANLQWVQASGKGKVISYTTVQRPHHDGFNGEAPYLFAAIALDEGPCLYGQLSGETTDGKSLVGQPVVAEFLAHGPQLRIAAFRLA